MILALTLNYINMYFFYLQVEYISGKVFFTTCSDLNMLKQLKSAERLFLLIKKQLPFSVSSVNKGKCMPVAFTYMIQCTPKSFAWQLICSRFTFLRIIHTPEIINQLFFCISCILSPNCVSFTSFDQCAAFLLRFQRPKSRFFLENYDQTPSLRLYVLCAFIQIQEHVITPNALI